MKFVTAASRDVTHFTSDSSDQMNFQVCKKPNQPDVQNPDEEQEVMKPSGKKSCSWTSKEEVKTDLLACAEKGV